MGVKKEILTVGFDKNGEADFGVSMSVCELTFSQMKELRAMLPVAIGVLENAWRDEQMRKPENMAVDATVMPNALAQADAACGVSPGAMGSAAGDTEE